MSLLLASTRRAIPRSSFVTTAFRYNSSSASSAASSSSLTWDQFLKQRIRRRRFNVGASVVTGFIGIIVGWGAVANVQIDPTQTIFGLDPLQALPIGLFLCGGLGSLAGPSLGSFIFRASLGKQFATFNQKNAEFLRHVQKMRPDPSKQTFANPVPDYYGEKIGSLKDYKRWLRDGRAYRRKCENFV